MVKLLDYSFARPDPAQIKADGFDGVLRYLAPLNEGGKILTKGEVDALQAQGLAIGLVWESYANRALEGSPAGVEDATEALRQARALGVPDSVPIFFAVDFDATPEQQAAINSYFDGVASVIKPDDIGMYGGFWPMSRAFDAGKIKWGWQTYAWSGGNWDPRAQLRQVENGQWNGQVDFDEGEQGLAGLWTVNNQGEQPMNQDDVKAMCEARGFEPSQAEVDKWSDTAQFPTFKDAMYDIVKQYPTDTRLVDADKQIGVLQEQLTEAQGNDKATIIDLQEKLDNANSMVSNLKSQLSNIQGPSTLDKLAQYNKLWVAVGGAVVTGLTAWLGVDSPVVQGVISVLSVLGVGIVPNKQIK